MTSSAMLVLAVCVCVMTGCSAGPAGEPEADAGDGFTRRTIMVDGVVYPYAVYRPAGLDRDAPARGLLFLHGYGECGTDGEKMLTVGLPPAIRANPERWPFVVVIPQKPTGDSEWEDHEQAVLAMLDREIERENIHPSRVAITGLSQGGHGTIALAVRHPRRFRAAAPVCGYVEPHWVDGERVADAGFPGPERTEEIVEAFKLTPLSLFHGEQDDVVPPAESKWLYRTLANAGVSCDLTLYREANHNSWDRAYGGTALARWLVQRTD